MVVGPDQYEHTIHRDLLCDNSPYFSTATKDCWKGDEEGRIPLPNDDPAVFALYIQWIYRRRIFCRQEMGDTGGNREEIGLLIEAFVLGEKLQDQAFRDAVVDCLIDAVDTPDGQDKQWYPSPGAIDRAYRGTPEGSPLRRLLVDMYFFHGRREWLDEATHADFLKDLAGEFLQDRGSFVTRADHTTAQLAGCAYHCHGIENACYSDAS